jgi:AAA family ATP:ADP antiporter
VTARTILARLVRFEEGEGVALFWSFAYFFFLLSSYYVIRPLRDAFGLQGREDALTLLYTGTLIGTLLANPVLGALVSRFPRRVFIPIVYHFLVLNLLIFCGLLSFLSGDRQLQIARVFFVWASVFNLFAVSVFWGFMADLFRSDQAKRLFGFIGMGGTLGAVAGAGVTATLAPLVGPVKLMLVAAVLLEGAVYCVRRLSRLGAQAGSVTAPTRIEEAEKPPGRGVLSGIRLVATSPYLLGICLFMLFYSVSSTLIYFEQARIVRVAFQDAAQRTAYFARVDLYVNLLTVLVQAFFTGRILAFLGVGGTLAALPAVTACGFAAIASAPVLTTLVALQVIRRTLEFSLIRPAREVLFTVVSREEKYTAKNLIDTFVYRTGDLAGAWLDRGLSLLALGVTGIAASFVPIAAVWVILALFLGRRQTALAERQLGAGPARS